MAFLISPEKIIGENGFYTFRKQVFLTDSNSNKAVISIFASSRYILHINGKYICEGPCRGTQYVKYYDEITTDEFKDGVNEITVKVLFTPQQFTTVFSLPKPALVCDISLGKEKIVSDSTWECVYNAGNAAVYHNMMMSLPPYEKIDTSVEDIHMETVQAEKIEFGGKLYSVVGAAIPFALDKRPIPMLYPQESISFNVAKSGDAFIEYDAGKYTTAKLSFLIKKHSTVKIIYAECYETESGKKKRDDTSGFLNGYFDIVHTGESDYVFEPFWFRAFRYIRIEAVNPQKTVKAIDGKFIHYPVKIGADFECSDSFMNEMWKVSINTLLCCMHEIIVDCPYYEQQQYVMDSAIECSALMRLSSDWLPVRKCITEFAASQQPNGLLLGNYPANYTQIITGFSFFWVYFLEHYLDVSGDLDFVYGQAGTMHKILNYFEMQVRKYGYIKKSEYWDFVDWTSDWSDGTPAIESGEALTIYNMYYAYALKCAEKICLNIGEKHFAEEYSKRYLRIKNTINELCFDKDKCLYKDGSKLQTYSIHTVIMAILADLTGDEYRGKFIRQLQNKEITQCSFSMGYYLFRAFEKGGQYKGAFEFFDNWKKMLELNCTTWCENPDNPRSECHAWSCAPIYEFSANILGVKTTLGDEIVIQPNIGTLNYARGTVPTRFGNVEVDWKISGGEFEIKVKSEDGIKKTIIMPGGSEHICLHGNFELSEDYQTGN